MYNCDKCHKRKCECCPNICVNVNQPRPIAPLPPVSKVIHEMYQVGSGSGPDQNQYTSNVPSGTQWVVVRSVGAGGGGGGQLSEIFDFGIIAVTTQTVQGGGGGGSGRLAEFSRPWAPGFPNTLNIEVGTANLVATDPTTGIGNPGNDSLVQYTPSMPGFEETRGVGGLGGGVGKSTGTQTGFAGEGAEGGNGGGGGGAFQFNITFSIPGGNGGFGKDRQNGDDGDITTGGDGGLNVNSGSTGQSGGGFEVGGGGGGGSGVVHPNSGGIGGPQGDMVTSNQGGDFQLQNTGAGGGGAGIYVPNFGELGSTINNSGGLGAHGFVEVYYYVFPTST